MSDNYAGVFNSSFGTYVFVGKIKYFPNMDYRKFICRIDLKGMNLKQLYEDLKKEAVFSGTRIVCYPSDCLPPEGWEAINMKIDAFSIDKVVESAKKYFDKFMHEKE